MRRLVTAILVLFLWTASAQAGHPLITDDAGTQGKGSFQVEINVEYSLDRESEAGTDIVEKAYEAAITLSYGIFNNADLVVGTPYQWIKTEEGGLPSTWQDGIADVSVELKWRFYDKDGYSLAVKPGISVPTGDEGNGLGNGRVSYSIFFISTRESGRWAFHVNGGYMRNEFSLDEDESVNRRDLWHFSVATELAATDALTLVANVGIEANPERGMNTPPAFVLGGAIYSLNEHADVDFGVKVGLNRPETDVSILAGITFKP